MREGSTTPFVPLPRRRNFGRLRRLVLKELREILRDRRTIITLVVMPILIYPLLAVVFQRFLFTSLPGQQNVEYVIGVDSDVADRMLKRQLQAGGAELERRAGHTPSAGRPIGGRPSACGGRTKSCGSCWC